MPRAKKGADKGLLTDLIAGQVACPCCLERPVDATLGCCGHKQGLCLACIRKILSTPTLSGLETGPTSRSCPCCGQEWPAEELQPHPLAPEDEFRLPEGPLFAPLRTPGERFVWAAKRVSAGRPDALASLGLVHRCENCPESFLDAGDLRAHSRICPMRKEGVSPECNRVLLRSSLQAHRRARHRCPRPGCHFIGGRAALRSHVRGGCLVRSLEDLAERASSRDAAAVLSPEAVRPLANAVCSVLALVSRSSTSAGRDRLWDALARRCREGKGG